MPATQKQLAALKKARAARAAKAKANPKPKKATNPRRRKNVIESMVPVAERGKSYYGKGLIGT